MLTATLENLLNRGLPRSFRAREICANLEGRSLALAIPHIARLRLTSTGVTLAASFDAEPADATLTGGPLALLALLGASAQAQLQRGHVAISGDAEIAEKFRELLELLRPDFEEELSLVTGDVPAHRLARLMRAGASWGTQAAGTALRNLAEYLAHESADLVSRNEGEQFLRGVDALREGVDRAQARLERLEQPAGRART
ncbi:MAG: SCP2 sterol-binding domain-containing protein [Gammaproteobacteria bacterium]|nr:SCP2 sterol-binding domain-containing protein [Gammaproteobacteria bacterium]